MESPTKFTFSPKYSEDVIFGALGLLDQGTSFFKASDMDRCGSREFGGRRKAGSKGEEKVLGIQSLKWVNR